MWECFKYRNTSLGKWPTESEPAYTFFLAATAAQEAHLSVRGWSAGA